MAMFIRYSESAQRRSLSPYAERAQSGVAFVAFGTCGSYSARDPY